ncbi:MAG: DMT family transporter [Pseudomonadota bacterium]
MISRAGLYAGLLGIGLAWGASIPAIKVATSTGHGPLGLVFWQLAISVLVLGLVIVARGGSLRLRRADLAFFLVIGAIGTVVPNFFSYTAARELPAGVMAIVIAMVPIFAFPIALLLRIERWEVGRILGLLLGAAAVTAIAAPEASLPDAGATFFVFFALIGPLCYGVEGNYLAIRGERGLDPVKVLFGGSILGLALATPLVLATGQWVPVPTGAWTDADRAVVVVGLLHALAYAGYVWLVAQAGPVFAAQVSYLVTGAGVLWSMLLLGERYSLWVWAALILILLAMALVQPRARTLEPRAPARHGVQPRA